MDEKPPKNILKVESEYAARYETINNRMKEVLHSEKPKKTTSKLSKATIDSVTILLQQMVNLDQEIREVWDTWSNDKKNQKFIEKIAMDIDQKNISNIKALLAHLNKDWFLISAFGEFGAICDQNAWIIVQHADDETQAHFLPILEKYMNKKESKPSNYAYLYDRVATSQGKMQKYGTQWLLNPLRMFPVEDPKNLDKRRKKIGLEPFDEYKKIMEKKYGEKQQ